MTAASTDIPGKSAKDTAAKKSAFPSRAKRVKTPYIQQFESVECGAAALGAMLAHYGHWAPLSELRRQCGVSRDGSKAANILRAARRYGFEAKGFSKGVESVKGMKPPFVVFWEFNHFLIVEGWNKKSVFLNDPAVGHRRVSWRQFDDGFTGVALAMEPGPEFKRQGRRPRVYPALWARTYGARAALFYTMLCGAMGIVPGLAAASYSRILVDEVIVGTNPGWLRPILLAMALTLAFTLASSALNGLFIRRMQMAMAARLQAQYVRHMLKLPYHFFAQRYVGEVVSRTGINDALVGLIAGQLTSAIIGIFTMFAYGAVLLTYNVPLAMLGIFSTFLNFIFLRLVADRRMEANLAIAKEQGKLQGATFAGINSIEMIKANGMENSFFERWAGHFASVNIARQQLAVDSQKFSVLPTVTGTFVNLLTMVFGAFYVLEGEMSYGELMAFNALMALFLAPITQILGLSVEFQQIRGSLARLDDVLDFETVDGRRARELSKLEDKTILESAHTPRLSGRIETRGLTFGYQPLEPPLIKGVSFTIEPGKQLALVGGSGSGKSTVAKIIAGLLEPLEGEVLFDNRPRVAIEPELLAASVAFVDQDIHIFAGTIRDNITLWDDSIPEEWVRDALADAGLLDDILALPGGIDARVAEGGSNFSGGQRQRIEIARALARRPSLLILDEATSALDVVTEAHVTESLRRRRCAALIVAHRLSTIRGADTIMVMRRGKIIEQGTHQSLWEAEGTYYDLVRREG